jgi:hypothetical protein
MAKTWGDIQNETLQLMHVYSINGTVTAAADNADYTNAMVHAANYALRDLASTVAPIIRKISLSVAPVANMLGDYANFDVVPSRGEDIIYTATDPKAYYFEVDNPCTVYIEEVATDGTTTTLHTLTNTAKRVYTVFSGLVVGATADAEVQMRFVGGNAYNIRNVAFYETTFAAAADVPPFTRYDRYNLRTLTAGIVGGEFMKLPPNSIVMVDGQYRQTNDFRWEGDDTLVLDHYTSGQYDITYHAYPTEITATTSTTFTPELIAEAIDLVPLYVAARLYSDDNPPLSTQYMNMYIARRAELADRDNQRGAESFYSESGWV